MKKPEIEKVQWDSDFFGYKIGKMVMDDSGSSSLKDAGKSLGDFDLCYVFSGIKLINDLDLFQDEKVIFEQTIFKPAHVKVHESVTTHNHTDEFISMFNLALISGQFSRFKLDNFFNNNEYERLYFEWLWKSLKRIIADEVLVYKINNRIVGFITLIKKSYLEIGLIATDPQHQGKGIGTQLISEALRYAEINNLAQIRVATQRRNIQAINFYLKNNFRVTQSTFIYHLWR